MQYIKTSIAIFLFLITCLFTSAQVVKDLPNSEYKFEITNRVNTTEVENQYHTGTCWSFSALSFFESELARMNEELVNLSEMFVVWHTYADKSKRYVRMHGNLKFGQGGAFHDVRYVARNYGLIPEAVYSGEEKPEHGELEGVLKGMVDAVIKNKNGALTNHWHPAIEKTLNTYLGTPPDTFRFKGKTYTPRSYAESLPLNPNNYVEVTSFSHHPFYEKFILEVPDNWRWDEMYNVPLDDLEKILDHALSNGYSVAWAGDVSGKGFAYEKGLATKPETRWGQMTQQERDSVLTHPVPQDEITQKARQDAFDRYKVTDDHGMHIIGTAQDQNGNEFYLIKNSWGTSNIGNGYIYASKSYILYKTTDIMLHKEAIPSSIAEKLNLETVSN